MTVSAVVEREGRFLMVEELVEGQPRFNQPSGHLDEDESLIEGVAREVLEETGWTFEPRHLIGAYLWKSAKGLTYLRFAFGGELLAHDPRRPLDAGILRAAWLTRAELVAAADRLRSPLVLRAIDDHLAGHRHPLAVLTHVAGDR